MSWLGLLPLLLPLLLPCFSGCPLVCQCSQRRGLVVQCVSQNLDSVPADLPKDTAVLLLSSNQISHIPSHAFAALPRLREINLSGNSIRSLEADAFQGVSEPLRSLDLSHNLLRSVSKETLGGMVGRIRLSHNPWHCQCSLQEVLRDLKLDPETVNQVSCHTSSVEEYVGRPVIQVLDSGGTFCLSGPQRSTDTALFFTMSCWFSMLMGYIVHYVRQNQQEARRHREYLKTLPCSAHIQDPTDTDSTGL
ncbi:leucine-rich repeat-containing protein 3 [Aplochiton taeniatus]